MPPNKRPVCITGSAGFIGKHLYSALNRSEREMMILDRIPQSLDLARNQGNRNQIAQADIRHLTELTTAGVAWAGKPVIHLAAEAEVLIPWEILPATFSTNLTGTWNVLEAFKPSLLIFPSTCSVYGTASVARSLPVLSTVCPVSLYGASKSMDELLIRDWVEDSSSAAVVLRLGNVIGAGCRGLVPYLVRHAMRYPQAEVSAELRGDGKLIRDYTPVEYVVQIFEAALENDWTQSSYSIFNVGTGRGLSNREIAGMVGRVLGQHGFKLQCKWDNPVPQSEAIEIVLNCENTARHFGIPLPSPKDVETSIENSVLSYLQG